MEAGQVTGEGAEDVPIESTMARAFPWTSRESLRSGLPHRVTEWEMFEIL